MLRSRIVTTAAVVMFAFWCGSAAAESGVSFFAARPLGHAYIAGQWCMLTVQVLNRTDTALDVEIVVPVRGNSLVETSEDEEDRAVGFRAAHYVKKAHLPAHSKRIVWFPGRLMGERMVYVHAVTEGGAQLAKDEFPALPLPPTALVVMGTDERELLPKVDEYLAARGAYVDDTGVNAPGRRGPSLELLKLERTGEVRERGTLRVRLPYFPDHWAGLDCVSAVAIGHTDHNDWRPSQMAALKAWLESGGVLLLFPPPDCESVLGSPLEKLLPVRIFGARKQNHLVLESKIFRQEVALPTYVDVLETELADGEVVYRDGDLPMVVRKRLGLGAIYFFAFPGSALDGWKERGTFLAQILRSHERSKPLSHTGLLTHGPQMLDEVAGAQVAPSSFVLATLGTFFGIAALTLALARVLRRTELAWAVIIPSGIAIAIVSHRVGMSYRKQVGLSINEIAVVSCASGSSHAFRSALLGIHTLQDRQGELVTGDRNTVLSSSSGMIKQTARISTDVFRASPAFRLSNLLVAAGQIVSYITDSPVELDGSVLAEFQLGPNGIVGTVTNQTSMNLKGCLLTVNAYPYVVGDIAPGERIEAELSEGNRRKRYDFTTEGLLGGRSQTRKAIVTNLFSPAQERAFVPWAHWLFLLAWPDRAFVSERLEMPGAGEVAVRSVAMLCVEPIIRQAAVGTEVLIPRSVCAVNIRYPKQKAVLAASIEDFKIGRDELEMVFLLPQYASNVRIVEAELHLSADAYGRDLIVRGRDVETGEVSDLETIPNLAGEKTIRIENAGRFQDRRSGLVVFSVLSLPNDQMRTGGTGGRASGVPGASNATRSAVGQQAEWLSEPSVTLRGVAQ